MGWAELDSSMQVAVYVVVAVTGVLALRQLRKGRKGIKKEDYKKDMVYLYGSLRHRLMPTISARSLKVEVWLRMAGVKYEYTGLPFIAPRSKDGTWPFVELNGSEISDSNLIIEHLARHFEATMDADLTPEQQAVSVAVTRMVDEHSLWGLYYYMFVDRMDLGIQRFLEPGWPRILLPFIGNRLGKGMATKLYWQGISRHSKAEVYQLGNTDIRALSDLLGDKPFFMGSKPSTVDAAVFSVLGIMVYLDLPDSPQMQLMVTSCRNLLDFCDRIKDRYYPDWAELCAQADDFEGLPVSAR